MNSNAGVGSSQADGGGVPVCVGAQGGPAPCARGPGDISGHRHDGIPGKQR